jgi:prepilin-type N-terminal cleavage/methylation domain-containing protein
MMKCSLFEPVVVPDDFRDQRGFTLVEMMAVTVMIALILGVTLPNLWRSAVRADMMSQVGVIQQSVGISRIYAIKNSSQVALQFLPDNAPVAKYEVHAWVDADGDGAFDGGEELVGKWPLMGEITIGPEDGNANHTLHGLDGTALGVVFFANGTAMVHNDQIGTGQGAVVLQDTYENQIRLTIQGGSGSVLVHMWNYELDDWVENPKNLWRY